VTFFALIPGDGTPVLGNSLALCVRQQQCCPSQEPGDLQPPTWHVDAPCATFAACLETCSPMAHLSHSLRPFADMQIRDSIKALFPDRDCLTLVRPMGDEKMLAKLETLDPSQFRPEFQEVCGLSLPTCTPAHLHMLTIHFAVSGLICSSLYAALPSSPT